ncbi:hypothetical protein BJ684DRAFT_21658 [Piptocephalis cylindrospora]|uniref:Uncharacterized protein n=1 Tax=Piptocephalis cylindrospora TaxID=1907219 RepID=A0A4P9Y011_9FUNG|nr:hypothetical protein BJ684DRAFT_21658 [Piptocephalis cylindrospora]|eukprot:RKP11762.1 hypothetical protein BJ684DRAFT_21658 [Piptocephalis cylindrospora]
MDDQGKLASTGDDDTTMDDATVEVPAPNHTSIIPTADTTTVNRRAPKDGSSFEKGTIENAIHEVCTVPNGTSLPNSQHSPLQNTPTMLPLLPDAPSSSSVSMDHPKENESRDEASKIISGASTPNEQGPRRSQRRRKARETSWYIHPDDMDRSIFTGRPSSSHKTRRSAPRSKNRFVTPPLPSSISPTGTAPVSSDPTISETGAGDPSSADGPKEELVPAEPVRPGWHTISWHLERVLHSHGDSPMHSKLVISEALKLDQKISQQYSLPRAFRGKTPENSASASLSSNKDRLFIPSRKGRKIYYKLAWKARDIPSAVAAYNTWMSELVTYDWPRCFGVPKHRAAQADAGELAQCPPEVPYIPPQILRPVFSDQEMSATVSCSQPPQKEITSSSSVTVTAGVPSVIPNESTEATSVTETTLPAPMSTLSQDTSALMKDEETHNPETPMFVEAATRVSQPLEHVGETTLPPQTAERPQGISASPPVRESVNLSSSMPSLKLEANSEPLTTVVTSDQMAPHLPNHPTGDVTMDRAVNTMTPQGALNPSALILPASATPTRVREPLTLVDYQQGGIPYHSAQNRLLGINGPRTFVDPGVTDGELDVRIQQFKTMERYWNKSLRILPASCDPPPRNVTEALVIIERRERLAKIREQEEKIKGPTERDTGHNEEARII